MEPSNKGANYDKINIWERKGILGGSGIGESIWVGWGGGMWGGRGNKCLYCGSMKMSGFSTISRDVEGINAGTGLQNALRMLWNQLEFSRMRSCHGIDFGPRVIWYPHDVSQRPDLPYTQPERPSTQPIFEIGQPPISNGNFSAKMAKISVNFCI